MDVVGLSGFVPRFSALLPPANASILLELWTLTVSLKAHAGLTVRVAPLTVNVSVFPPTLIALAIALVPMLMIVVGVEPLVAMFRVPAVPSIDPAVATFKRPAMLTVFAPAEPKTTFPLAVRVLAPPETLRLPAVNVRLPAAER